MKRVYIIMAALTLGMASCSKDNGEPTKPITEIKVGEDNSEQISLGKNSTKDLKLSGGNGKFTLTVQDSKVVEAKIEGDYLKIKGLNYGTTSILLRSHDREKRLSVKVERPEISLASKEVQLFPGEERRNIKVTGGGDDAELLFVNDEKAIEEPRWDAKTGILELVARHEGVAKVIFRTKDGKPDVELAVIVKAENDVSTSVGFYSTKERTLRHEFPVAVYGHRPGKKVWIANSTKLPNSHRVLVSSIQNPQKGAKIKANFTFVNVSDKFTSGERDVIIEEVREAEGLVSLRAEGFKLVIPYDK